MRITALVCAVLLVSATLPAQNAPVAATTRLPVYDVVSVKPNKTGSGHVDVTVDDGKFEASNASLALLIEAAYGYKRDQIIGLEGPVNSARFDIQAKVLEPDLKALNNLSRDERGRMLRPILADRFHLAFHTEMRSLPVYELVTAKNGPKMTQTTAANTSAGDGKSFHGTSSGSVSMHSTRNSAELIAHDVPLSVLASELSSSLRRTVMDKTGLTGKYDIWLKWTPDDSSAAMDKSADNGAAADAGPGLFTALEEQLGLRLQGSKDPVETMVIDHIEMPEQD